jgi:hypothetical protein
LAERRDDDRRITRQKQICALVLTLLRDQETARDVAAEIVRGPGHDLAAIGPGDALPLVHEVSDAANRSTGVPRWSDIPDHRSGRLLRFCRTHEAAESDPGHPTNAAHASRHNRHAFPENAVFLRRKPACRNKKAGP